MMIWTDKSLGASFMRLIAGVLLATSFVFLLIFAPLYRHELLQERKIASSRVAATLQIALENAMLKRDIDGLRQIVETLGRTRDLASAMILDPQGEVRFASQATRIGATQPIATLCPGCDGAPDLARPAASASGFLRDADGREVLRSVIAVPNRPACAQCHGAAADHPINGYLVVDFVADDVVARTWSTAAALAAAGLVVAAVALGAIWFGVRRRVVGPLERLSAAIASASQTPDAPPTLASLPPGHTQDEISSLTRGWNDLALRLDGTIRELRRRDSFQQSLLDALPDGVRVIADDYSVVAVNAEFLRQSGLTREQALGRPCYASSHGRDAPCVPTMVLCPLAELRSAGARLKASHIHVDGESGGHFAAEVAAALLETEAQSGGRRLVVESIRDLSQHAQVSQQQRLSELGVLAAGVAHEIHNPLASIRLGLEAIDRSFADCDAAVAAREFMSAVNAEVDRCLAITDRMLRLSRIPEEGGVLVELGALARDTATLLRYEAEARHVTMAFDVEADARVIAAEGDLGMILVNLIQNALHAMPKGGTIRVAARTTPERDVVVEIADEGVGIAPEHLSKIFHPFWSWRADGSSGSGLGLAICQSLAEKWDGEISARSELGQGATFTVRLPHADKALEREEQEAAR